MNSTRRHLTELTALAATILGLVLVTAGQASAMRPEPGPTGPVGTGPASHAASTLSVADSSISVLQWVLFVAVVVGALIVGAAFTHLVERRRIQLAH